MGEPKEDMLRTLAHIGPRLPQNKPRYLMAWVRRDLVDGVANGVDMLTV